MAGRRKKKSDPIPIPHVDGDFQIQGCDQSLHCPGFALIRYTEATRTVELVRKGSQPNKTWTSKKKPLGQVLCEISEYFGKFLLMMPTLVVRERSFSRFSRETQILQKVEGLTDMLLWSATKNSFYEIGATEVKKWMTGNGRAEKQDVAGAQSQYVGEQKYTNEDESDACAVAIAFQLRENYLDQPDGKEET